MMLGIKTKQNLTEGLFLHSLRGLKTEKYIYNPNIELI